MERYILSLTIIFYILFCTACYKPDYKPEDTIIQSENSLCDEIINISNSGSVINTEGLYSIGDTITSEHRLKEFDYCYPSNLEGASFSFANNQDKVFMIEMSASW